MDNINAIGRRKTSVARVYMRSGDKSGKVIVNGKPIEEYFGNSMRLIKKSLSPFDLLGIKNTYSIKINVQGGGFTGQSGAIKLGISRALAQLDEKTRKILRKNGFLTRDPRMVERKKPYKRKARKSEQYSKR
ncbi:MAG: 30S ribosomal protein S9 [Elusimicrobiota bacterium]